MVAKFHELGDVRFVVNVGDSFYPGGVSNKSDPQWQLKWRNMYARELRSVPWYSVYGNHDYHRDPCACSDSLADCAQVNANESDLAFFYMPAPNWFKEHPELGLEVIGLDLNHYMWAWDHQVPPERQVCGDCKWTPCKEQCEKIMRSRADRAFRLFRRRAAASLAKIFVAFSHYPTDYFWQVPGFLAGLSNNSRRHVEYFGGHRHNTDNTSTISTAPNSNWVVGGGGGWSCEPTRENASRQQGFVVGEISMDFKLTTYSVLVNTRICCPLE